MSNDTGIFEGLNSQILMRTVIIMETCCALFCGITYLKFPGLFFMYLPWFLVIHALTVMVLPSVFRKLNADSKQDLLHYSGAAEQEENLHEIDLWDRTVVGFYVFSNGVILLICTSILYF